MYKIYSCIYTPVFYTCTILDTVKSGDMKLILLYLCSQVY